MRSLIMRPNLLSLSVFTFALVALFVSSAAAQLSQLDFDNRRDRLSGAQPVPEKVLNSILAGKEFVKPSKTNSSYQRARLSRKLPSQETKKEEPNTAKAPKSKGLRTEKITLEQDLKYIIPRVQGPFTDRDNSSSITTERYWELGKYSSCASVASEQGLRQKSASVKELLHRFTGSDSYFDKQTSLCKSHCAADIEEPILSGVALFTGDGSTFEIVERSAKCYYQLAKPADTVWHPLDGTKAACTCIPK
jgi:hypothetical protein